MDVGCWYLKINRMHFQTAFKHIRRSPYQALSAVMIMTFTFFMAAIFLLLATGSFVILNFFEAKPQITTFFKDKTKPETITRIKKVLENSGKISIIKSVSKEEALAIYKEQNKNDPLLLEMVTADILPASLEISAKNITDLKEIYNLVKKEESIEEVVYQKDIIDNLTKWTNGLRRIGLGIVIFLIIDSVLIILTIIGMKIALRKEEIEILKLLGASNWYVSLPFIIEGVIYGLLGAFFGWGVTYIAIWQATPLLQSFLLNTPLYPIPYYVMLIILALLFLTGFIIGVVGSIFALRRYLK